MVEDFDRFCRMLVEGSPDAIIAADRDGTICAWNGGAERIFGWSAAEALGRSLDLIIPDQLRARHWAGYRQTMTSGVTRYGAGELLAVPAQRKDRARISVEFTIVPMRGADGRMEGIAAVMRDVTARFEEMKALRRQIATKGA
ncbi:MAG: PAS domain S-box protein [Alphaproteobacteria bacterium]|nr:PAS domain S-box protein [Alphaproteobacteria bacterium]